MGEYVGPEGDLYALSDPQRALNFGAARGGRGGEAGDYATRGCPTDQSLKVLREAEQILLAQRYTRNRNRWVSPVGIR
jgi:hypothetical protein